MAYEKPVPLPSVETQPFWDACKRHELIVQACNRCGNTQFYPRMYCVSCLSGDLAWKKASGRGTVYSFTVVHRAPSAGFKPDVPYVVALVELEEGVRLMSNIVNCAPEEVRFAMPVKVLFEDITADVALPKFQPA